MRTPRGALFWAIGALIVTANCPVRAKENPTNPETPLEIARRLIGSPMRTGEELSAHDPNATAKALRALLAVSNAEIPASSSCQGHYGPWKATVKDLLAIQLAYMYPGGNYLIQGNCRSGQCAVIIDRRAGEDVSSATITFDKVHGKASVPTLQCLITP